MLIEFLPPSPRASERDNVSHTTAAALIAAGLAREVFLTEEEKRAIRFGTAQAPAPAPTVSWGITTGTVAGRVFVVAKCSAPNCSTFRFEGEPKVLGEFKFIHSRCAHVPESVPKDIVAEYTKAKRGERARETADMADYSNAKWGTPGIVKVAGKEISTRPEGI